MIRAMIHPPTRAAIRVGGDSRTQARGVGW